MRTENASISEEEAQTQQGLNPGLVGKQTTAVVLLYRRTNTHDRGPTHARRDRQIIVPVSFALSFFSCRADTSPSSTLRTTVAKKQAAPQLLQPKNSDPAEYPNASLSQWSIPRPPVTLLPKTRRNGNVSPSCMLPPPPHAVPLNTRSGKRTLGCEESTTYFSYLLGQLFLHHAAGAAGRRLSHLLPGLHHLVY